MNLIHQFWYVKCEEKKAISHFSREIKDYFSELTSEKTTFYPWIKGTQQETDYMEVPSVDWGDVKIHLKE
jgi:hypothetical protein